MSVIPVKVKWSGQTIDVDVDLSEPGSTFKSQLYSITGVPLDRQKILVKGGQLKDETDMSTLGLTAGKVLMMMGSAGALPTAPVQKIKFAEELNEHELALSEASPPGLTNLGNTCYMNSTLQMLRAIPELQTSLSSYKGSNLSGSLRDLYKQMDRTGSEFTPAMFLNSLRQVFPQFAERSRSGPGYAQQDAEECWSQIVHMLRTNLAQSSESKGIDQYMAGRLVSSMTCDETEAEPVVESSEDFIKLNCHIDASTNFMVDGIRQALTDKIEKRSDVLDRNAQFTKKSQIARLPKYLSVSFVRFFFKAGIQKKAKILRKVKFPFDLDASELCTPELHAKIAPIRDRVREVQKAEFDAERARKRTKTKLQDENKDKMEIDAAMSSIEASESKVNLAEEVAKLMAESHLEQDEGANNCGLYELIGVLTHSGASADSGHYQAWMRGDQSKGGNDQDWYRFNDDKVSIVSKEKIESLDGGGESDSAFILLYRSKF